MKSSASAAAACGRQVRGHRPVALWSRGGLGLVALCAACATGPQTTPSAAPAGLAAPSAQAAASGTPAQAQAAPVQPGSRPLLVWSGPVGEPLPVAIRQALGSQAQPAPGGALSAASQTVAESRLAFTEMRCSDALPKLSQAAEAVLGEALLPEARPLLSELYGLMLLCADRVGDPGRAAAASEALRAMQATLPSDVALVQARYEVPGRFGPTRAPVHVESDPPGAVVLRNLIPVGVTPLDVGGGVPERDFLDIELPGFRKLHRPLSSGQQIILTLRPEDRPPVLLDRAALFAPGSDGQGAVLKALAETSGAAVLVSRRVLVLGPKQRTGAPAAGEALMARVYDLDRKGWVGPSSEVASGPPATQAQALLALAGSAGGAAAVPAGAVAGGTSTPAKPAAQPKSGFKLPFSNTKWYTWVVAGGVAALIAGLLIAERVSPEKVTISVTH